MLVKLTPGLHTSANTKKSTFIYASDDQNIDPKIVN